MRVRRWRAGAWWRHPRGCRPGLGAQRGSTRLAAISRSSTKAAESTSRSRVRRSATGKQSQHPGRSVPQRSPARKDVGKLLPGPASPADTERPVARGRAPPPSTAHTLQPATSRHWSISAGLWFPTTGKWCTAWSERSGSILASTRVRSCSCPAGPTGISSSSEEVVRHADHLCEVHGCDGWRTMVGRPRRAG
jgi:hypothetical protein